MSQLSANKSWMTYFMLAILMVVVVFLLTYRLSSWPSVWWDEGWYLDATRNWIEKGHLGHYLDGQMIPPRIPVRFPVAMTIALSMKLFGVGVWQGRLPIILSTILFLILFIYLSIKIYNNKIAIVALIALLISPSDFNPIVLGRQILAEMPMLFYLFAGYVMIWFAIRYSRGWGLAASLFFGLAINAKLQVPPFWIISVILAIWVAVKYQQKSIIKILSGITIGSIVTAGLVLLIQKMVMPGSFDDPSLIKILFNSVIMVFSWPIRKIALTNGVIYALPPIFGLFFIGKKIIRFLLTRYDVHDRIPIAGEIHKEILRAALWGLGASWCLWYLSMGLFWLRYLAPPFIIGCIFFAASLSELSNDFDMRFFVRKTSSFLLGREINLFNFQALVATLAFSIILGVSIKSAYFNISGQIPNPKLSSEYLEDNILAGSTVETFESELLFLTPKINFHYPSDLISMQLIRKWCIEPQFIIDYDPLESEPDYIVSGWYDQLWHLYDEAIIQGGYQLEANIGGYKIYHVQTVDMK